MAALVAYNGRHYIEDSANAPMNIEERALDFFRRADMSESLEKTNVKNDSRESAIRSVSIEHKAMDFFWRAKLSESLQKIWESIRRQRFSTVLKLIKAVAIITAVVLFSQSISVTGLLALVGTIAGLLFATITNALVWLIYIPLYFVTTADFASSILLAIGLAWLAGISPFVALVFSPLVLFGFRLVEGAELAQTRVSDLVDAIGKAVEKVHLGEAIQQAAGNITEFIGGVFSQRPLKLAPPLPLWERGPGGEGSRR